MSIESRQAVDVTPEGTEDAPLRAAEAVTVRFWAGARAVAGTETTSVEARTVGELRAALVAWQPLLAPVLEVSSLLVDGRATSDPAARLDASVAVEVLPPFAGG